MDSAGGFEEEKGDVVDRNSGTQSSVHVHVHAYEHTQPDMAESGVKAERAADRDECKEDRPPNEPAPCQHAELFVNHGVPLSESDPRLGFEHAKDCDGCGKGFLNWVCVGCLQVFCGRTAHRWNHRCGGLVAPVTIDMAAVSAKCTPCGRTLSNEEVASHPNLLKVVQALHDVKFGHRLLLQPKRSHLCNSRELQGNVALALGASQSIEQKWKEFQDKFQAILDQSVEQIIRGFKAHHAPLPPPPAYVPTEAERAACFGADPPSIEAFARGVKSGRFKNIVVVAGAGMSCAAGLPDFRTPGTGLYSQLEKYDLPTPHSMFDIEYFKTNPKPFHVFAKELYPGRYAPARAHYFLRLLELKGVLSRVYTQNVDGLEELAGVSEETVIQCHGGFKQAHCVECRQQVDTEAVRTAIYSGEIARCPECNGLAKPGIVFFGEALRTRFHKHRMDDLESAGAMLVIGTSLSVAPTCNLPRTLGKDIPRVLVNREVVGDFQVGNDTNYRDVPVMGDCDAGVDRLAVALGWKEELDALVLEGQRKHPEAFARSTAAVVAQSKVAEAAAKLAA